MIVAALFHDVGHLATDVQSDSNFDLASDDDDHEPVARASSRHCSERVLPSRSRCTSRRSAALHARAGVSRPAFDRVQATLIAQGDS